MGTVRRARVAGFWHRIRIRRAGRRLPSSEHDRPPDACPSIGVEGEPPAPKRRLLVAASSLLSWPGLGWGQPLNRLKRIGILGNIRPPAQSNDPLSVFIGALRDVGWSEAARWRSSTAGPSSTTSGSTRSRAS